MQIIFACLSTILKENTLAITTVSSTSGKYKNCFLVTFIFFLQKPEINHDFGGGMFVITSIAGNKGQEELICRRVQFEGEGETE